MRTRLFLAAAVLATACAGDAEERERDLPLPDIVDVAENMGRFVFDSEPVLGDGLPAHGNNFITQGYVYPGGYLDDREGVLADGSPAFPEDVIGEWTCRGYFVGNGMHTETGPVVVTSQLFDFYLEPGYAPNRSSGLRNVVTEGYELIDVGIPVRRTMTGGTGLFAGVSGQIEQELMGFNPSQGVNLRVRFDLRGAGDSPPSPCSVPDGNRARCAD